LPRTDSGLIKWTFFEAKKDKFWTDKEDVQELTQGIINFKKSPDLFDLP